jgi:MFS family permease
MLLAIPMGQLADRFGRGRVFISGYVVLLMVYGLLLLPWFGAAQVLISLVLLGTYYAATDGVLMALGSAILPQDLRTSGLALLTTATNIGRLVASILFGFLWSWQGMSTAIWVFIAGLFVSTLLAAWLFASSRWGVTLDAHEPAT